MWRYQRKKSFVDLREIPCEAKGAGCRRANFSKLLSEDYYLQSIRLKEFESLIRNLDLDGLPPGFPQLPHLQLG